MSLFIFFFFSSRRRHTRLQGDWSSDVCSSDLPASPWWPKNGTAFRSKPVATINNRPLLFILRKPPLTEVMSPRFLPCVKRQRTATKRHRRHKRIFVFLCFFWLFPGFLR